MATDSAFIEINRVMKEKGTYLTKRDNIRREDIRSFRPWYKKEGEDDIAGETTAIYVINTDDSEDDKSARPKDDKGKLHRIRIQESMESFQKRIGTVIRVNGQIVS